MSAPCQRQGVQQTQVVTLGHDFLLVTNFNLPISSLFSSPLPHQDLLFFAHLCLTEIVPASTVPVSTVPVSTVPASTVAASTVPRPSLPPPTLPSPSPCLHRRCLVSTVVPASTVAASTVPRRALKGHTPSPLLSARWSLGGPSPVLDCLLSAHLPGRPPRDGQEGRLERQLLQVRNGVQFLATTTSKPTRDGFCVIDRSDGARPHLVNIRFFSDAQLVVLYVDFKLDESYTPSKISIRAGDGFHNLKGVSLLEPQQKSAEFLNVNA
ncbi:hypothetical protein Syun_018164 [Stephania yunnanensis]|uniref:DOC domain-containing protein n=1 Tax=Stephania yunnanensis TaxID=152371 RepID=A0AAP0NUR7_9MAGN